MATVMEQIERPTAISTRRTWRVDQDASYASFVIRNRFASFNHQVITGRFNDVSGFVMFDDRHPADSRLTIDIDVAGLSSGNRRRDNHLKAANFFAIDQHPVMSFVSTSVKPIDAADDRFDVTGMLLIRGIERAASFLIQLNPNPSASGMRSAQFIASGTLDRRDFGMIWSNPMVRIAERVDISLSVRTVLTDSATG